MKGLLFIAAIIGALVLLSASGVASHIGYFQSHGCHYIHKENFMHNHIYVCPKK